MIFIIDDEEPVRDALAWLLRSRGFESRSFASAGEFRRHWESPEAPAPACVILDVRMPDMSGIELFDAMRASGLHLAWPVIFLTGHGDVPMAVTALKDGAFDFVEKPMNDNSLVDKVAAALEASKHYFGQDAARAARRARQAALTDREREVMRRIAAGQLNKVIAGEMGISMRTVEVHRARIFQKMGVRTAVELVGILRDGDDAGS